MSAKILFDPIYSARPSKCSSAAKTKKMVMDTLSLHEDVFVYWLVPDFMFSEQDQMLEDIEWMPKHERLKYIPFDYSKDRMKAYRSLPDALADMIKFDGELWDIDLIVTMRSQLVPNMKILMNSPRQGGQEFLKKVLVFEEMPVMDFKATVAVSCPEIQDRETVTGYMAADYVLSTLDYEKQGILQGAKETYQPSIVRKLESKIKVANPATSTFFNEKKPEYRFKGDRPFCIGHVGRVGNMERVEDVFEVMEKHWVMKGDAKIRALFTTVSVSMKKKPPEFVEVQHPPREQFWDILQKEMDLVIYLSPEGGFGLGFFEVLFFGTPMLVAKEKWTVSLLGEDYPFYVRTVQDTYAMVKAWYEDYEGQYKVFHEWQQNVLKKRFEKGGMYELSYYDLVQSAVEDAKKVTGQFLAKYPNKNLQLIAREVVRYVGAKKEFILHDVLGRLVHDKVFLSMANKLYTPEEIGVVWATPWNEVRQILKAHYGWQDGSTTPGHLIKLDQPATEA